MNHYCEYSKFLERIKANIIIFLLLLAMFFSGVISAVYELVLVSERLHYLQECSCGGVN